MTFSVIARLPQIKALASFNSGRGDFVRSYPKNNRWLKLNQRVSTMSPSNRAASGELQGGDANGGEPVFTILEEEITFQRYLTFYNRRVRFPTTSEHPEVSVLGK